MTKENLIKQSKILSDKLIDIFKNHPNQQQALKLMELLKKCTDGEKFVKVIDFMNSEIKAASTVYEIFCCSLTFGIMEIAHEITHILMILKSDLDPEELKNFFQPMNEIIKLSKELLEIKKKILDKENHKKIISENPDLSTKIDNIRKHPYRKEIETILLKSSAKNFP